MNPTAEKRLRKFMQESDLILQLPKAPAPIHGNSAAESVRSGPPGAVGDSRPSSVTTVYAHPSKLAADVWAGLRDAVDSLMAEVSTTRDAAHAEAIWRWATQQEASLSMLTDAAHTRVVQLQGGVL